MAFVETDGPVVRQRVCDAGPLRESSSGSRASLCALRLTAVEIALMRTLVDYESPKPSRAKVETDRSLGKAVQENEHAQTDVPEYDHLDSTLSQTDCRRVLRQFVLKWRYLPLRDLTAGVGASFRNCRFTAAIAHDQNGTD